MRLPLRCWPRREAEQPGTSARRRQGVPRNAAASLPPRPSPLGRAVPTSWGKYWASFSHSFAIPQSLPLPGHQRKALPALCGAGSPLDKPHPQEELILAMASVVHTISSVLPTDKKRLEQQLPPLRSGLLENHPCCLASPGCVPGSDGEAGGGNASVPHAQLWGAPAHVPA